MDKRDQYVHNTQNLDLNKPTKRDQTHAKQPHAHAQY